MNMINRTKAHEEIDKIFLELLPQCGMAVRETQVRLCHDMLEGIPRNAEDSQRRDQEFLRIASEKEALNQRLNNLRQEQEIMAYTSGRVKALFDTIREKGGALREYDDRLAAQIIQQVTVLSKDLTRVKFGMPGVEMDMALN